MKTREDSRAGRDRFLRPLDNAERGLAAGSPSAAEPEDRNAANNAPEGETDLQENQTLPVAADPEPAPEDAAPEEAASVELASNEAAPLEVVSLRPVRPAERRAQEFLPQWLKRQGRAWPG